MSKQDETVNPLVGMSGSDLLERACHAHELRLNAGGCRSEEDCKRALKTLLDVHAELARRDQSRSDLLEACRELVPAVQSLRQIAMDMGVAKNFPETMRETATVVEIGLTAITKATPTK